jgi:hypothetical protein
MPTMIFIPSESIAFANCLASLSVGNVSVCLVGADDFNRPATNHPAELIDREPLQIATIRPAHHMTTGREIGVKAMRSAFFENMAAAAKALMGSQA